MNKNFYLTTTLPYVNAPLHMGHALEFVRADSIVHIKLQQDVYFNTGQMNTGLRFMIRQKKRVLILKFLWIIVLRCLKNSFHFWAYFRYSFR